VWKPDFPGREDRISTHTAAFAFWRRQEENVPKHPRKKTRNLKKLPYGLMFMQILFKECLQEMPEEQAERLIEGYKQGKNICLVFGKSSYGEYCKTAFACWTNEDQKWRGFPDAVGGIQ
jgi:hypothetical protein